MNSFPLFGGNKQKLLDDIARAMQSIGYKGDLLVSNWEYSDVVNSKGKENKTGIIELAGYAQTPQDYRNACIAVATSNGDSGANLVAKHRSVGAPLFFEINDINITRWKVTQSGKPELKEIIQHNEVFSAFSLNSEVWKPERIFRAKIDGEIDGVTQLDFFDIGLLPLLEGMIHKKLDRLLKEVLAKMVSVYEEAEGINPSYEEYQEIYRVIFRFIVAKVMKDRKHQITPQNDAVVILKAIEAYYNPPQNVTIESTIKQRTIEIAWQAISNGFQFQNLSVDDLAFVYESSLVTPETRKLFGTHSTPPRVAEYIVRKLPFDEVPINERYVVEPCAGHGAFLIPALRRLRESLPSSYTAAERHKYLIERLTGIEFDSFAVEACWSRLVLADYPQPNGWNLIQKNVFENDLLLSETSKANILFCNPPFEDFDSIQKNHYKQFHSELLTQKPAEILRQILQHPPKLLGLILPRRFESGAAYRQFHRQIAETYDRVELVAVPEIFNFSDSTPTLIMASGKREFHGNVSVFCRRVDETEKKGFLKGEIDPPAAKAFYSSEDYLKSSFSLWIAPLSRIWAYLDKNPKLEDIAQIHIGLQWKARQDKSKQERKEISSVPKKGYSKGYARVSDSLRQYVLNNPQYLSNDPKDLAVPNPHSWTEKKVVYSTARLGRGGWRLGAVADEEGLLFGKRFFGVWVEENVSIFAVAALLNSPLSNAYIYSQTTERDNHARIVKTIPLPSISALSIGGALDKLSKRLHQQMREKDYKNGKTTLLKIDAEILREYDLPPYLERELLELFQNVRRPVPFEFSGYYPKEFKAYFPLHEIISEQFELARADSMIKKLPTIDDKELGKYLDYLFEENHDEQ